MSVSINTRNIPSTYAAQPGYQPVASQDFNAPPAYMPTQGYAPAGSQVPPPQYSQGQQSTNNIVVVQQSAPMIPVIVRPEGYQADAGQAALTFAIIVTVIIFICGCWWSLIFSIPGMVYASSANNAGIRGDRTAVQSNNRISLGCTSGSILSTVVGLGLIFGLGFGLLHRRCNYYPYSSYCYNY